jgi:hypothetical protein
MIRPHASFGTSRRACATIASRIDAEIEADAGPGCDVPAAPG